MPNRAKEELLKVLTCGCSHDYRSDPLSGFPYWRNEKARDGHSYTHHIKWKKAKWLHPFLNIWGQDAWSELLILGQRTKVHVINAGGSHIDVACRSVCDQDQNGIKRSTFFLGADQGIKVNSERLISTDQHTFSDT